MAGQLSMSSSAILTASSDVLGVVVRGGLVLVAMGVRRWPGHGPRAGATDRQPAARRDERFRERGYQFGATMDL